MDSNHSHNKLLWWYSRLGYNIHESSTVTKVRSCNDYNKRSWSGPGANFSTFVAIVGLPQKPSYIAIRQREELPTPVILEVQQKWLKRYPNKRWQSIFGRRFTQGFSLCYQGSREQRQLKIYCQLFSLCSRSVIGSRR